jgi:hypothetical protein
VDERLLGKLAESTGGTFTQWRESGVR